MIKRIALFSLIVLSFAFTVGVGVGVKAEIYKWTDKNGQVHYGNAAHMRDQGEKIELKINSYEGVKVSNQNISNSSKVTMYSTSWCVYCKKARRYFKSNNIPFNEYDIEKNKKAKREYDKLGGRGVPVILVGKQKMTGFSKQKFDQLYARR